MRKIRFILCITFSLFASSMFSQTTGNFNYQAVVRDSEGNLITNKSMTVQLSIIESTADGNEIYKESHSVTSSKTGLINLLVGNGSSSVGDFASINWGENAKFIKIEVNPGNGLVDMGTFQLFSVPFAHYAMEVENKDDADANPTNEIQDLSLSNDVLTITNHPSPTAINLAPFTGNNTDEQDLTLVGDSLKISNGNGVLLPYDSSNWVINGTTMYYNGGNVGIGSSTPVSNLEVKGTAVTSDALFQVINSNNDTVFAVYPDGVKIFIDSEAKGKVGGFAISGRSPSKAGGVEIFRATVDSTRIYVSDTVSSKGKVGGFAISGRSPSKGNSNDYLVVTGDSTRIYINDTSSTKGKVGGFAISGRSPSKGPTNDYLQINRDSTRIYITESATKGKVGGFAISGRSPSKAGPIEKDYFNISANTTAQKINNESRIMWYPEKSAFMGGEVHVGSADSVGTNSAALGYRNIAMGDWSQAFGFQSKALGTYSTAIGNEAEAEDNSLAVGYQAKATGISSYALGSGALATADKSFAFGSVGIDSAGLVTGNTRATGEYSFAFGLGAEASDTGCFAMGANVVASGYFSTAIGYYTTSSRLFSTALGAHSEASGVFSTAMGYYSKASGVGSTAIGRELNATGLYSIAMGRESSVTASYGVAIGYLSSASASRAVAIGKGNTASGDGAVAIGKDVTASGNGSFATGELNTSGANYSNTMGYNNSTSISATYATAIGRGSQATNIDAVAFGYNTIASGASSFAMGYNTTAQSFMSLVIGRNNVIAGATSAWNGTDPLFVAGNGDTPSTRSNALVLYKNGNLNISGALDLPITTVTSNTTLGPTNHTILVNSTSDITITLPLAATCTGRIYIIKRINSGNVTISRAGTDTIDGLTTQTISTLWGKFVLQSNGTNWYIIN